MALSANTVWEVRTTGDDTNGGGFVNGASGTDWSQQDSPQYSVTDAVTDGTTTITSATANFGTDVVGNILYIQGGTGSITAGWYQITARTNATTITVDRSTGLTTGTGATLKIGGALLTIAAPLAVWVAGNDIWVRGGTYNITTALSVGGTTTRVRKSLRGYGTTRGDGGLPLITTASAITIINCNVASGSVLVQGFELDGQDTATIGVQMGTGGTGETVSISRCKISRCTNYGIFGAAYGLIERCEIFDLTAGAVANINDAHLITDCYVHDSVGLGIVTNTGTILRCIVTNVTSHGFSVASNGSFGNLGKIMNCIAWNNAGSGIQTGQYGVLIVKNSISGLNSGYGLNISSEGSLLGDIKNYDLENYNAFYSNTSGSYNNTVAGTNDIALTVDPFIDSANGDFRLNNTAGGGAELRNAGFPGLFPGDLTTGYTDIGAAQHEASTIVKFYGIRQS